MRAAAVVLAASVAAIGCTKTPVVENDPAATAAALAALQDRVKKVGSYSLEGTITDVKSGQAVRFQYALRQPQLLYARIEELDQVLVFDGTTIFGIDHKNKAAMKQSLAGLDDGSKIAAVYQMFGQFVAEGWRPPLMRTDPTALEGKIVNAPDPRTPPSWILTSKLDDDTIAAVRYQLHAPKADFVQKEFVDKQGKVVAFTRVTEHVRDDRTQLSFPKAWEKNDATGHVKIALTKWAVNDEPPLERFQPTIPEGYTVHEGAPAPAVAPPAPQPVPAPAAPAAPAANGGATK
jgi:outer membrane lipoprotein-sorting protein